VKRSASALSWPGLLGALIMLLVLMGATWAQGGPLFLAPGPLSARHPNRQTLRGATSHADFEGACENCHALPWSADRTTDRCLVCHVDVGDALTAKQGFHGRLKSVTACKACHTDHRGRDRPIEVLYPPSFPHEETTFSLEKHKRLGVRPFECLDCHSAEYLPFDQGRCAECHSELNRAFMTDHQQRFGDRCLSCHDGSGKVLKVDHSQTAFPLTDAHAEVKCEECHGDQQFKGTPTDCYACHRRDDKHNGEFGTACGTCHQATRWKDATFDHSTSGFALAGAHERVSCEGCHAGGQFKDTPTDCYACHRRDDTHRGGLGTDCAKCHRTTTWKPSTYMHPSVRGGHLGGEHYLTCARCHPHNDFSQYTCTGSGCHSSNNPRGEPGEGSEHGD